MTYDHALDCANNFGMCEIDELLDLSEGLNESAATSRTAPRRARTKST